MHFLKKYSNINRRLTKNAQPNAEMSEWFKEHDWKSCDAGMYPEVQILFSAPTKKAHLSTKANVLFLNDVCLRQMLQGVAL